MAFSASDLNKVPTPKAPKGYSYLGSGTFNDAFISKDKRTVLKIPKYPEDKSDNPLRAVRLWNLMNPEIGTAKPYVTEEGLVGWTCPFVKGHHTSEEDISRGLIDCYTRTGRIVIDGFVKNNLQRTSSGKVSCIDVGFALQLEEREQENSRNNVRRRRSEASLETWRLERDTYLDLFKNYEPLTHLAVNTVPALLFIQKHRPDILDVGFLKNYPHLIPALAAAYNRSDDLKKTAEALGFINRVLPPSACNATASLRTQLRREEELILEEKQLTEELQGLILENRKTRCLAVLKKYINSREPSKEDNKISRAFFGFFRDAGLTHKKVSAAKGLVAEIEAARSAEEIAAVVHTFAPGSDELFKGNGILPNNGLKAVIDQCKQIVGFNRNGHGLKSTL